jgi:M6 family metalloprotease-like protein
MMTLDFAPIHRWYRMPKPSRDYSFALEWPMSERRRFVEDAVRSADRDVDFRGYHIVYIVTPRGTPAFRTTWFLLPPGREIRADGTDLRHAILVWGTEGRWSHLVHNTAHLLGLPDRYDRELLFAPMPQRAASIYVGGWDVMGWNEMTAHFFAWHKRKLGWLGPGEVVCLEAGVVEETIRPLAIPGGVNHGYRVRVTKR